jgi:hypothetical protein
MANRMPPSGTNYHGEIIPPYGKLDTSSCFDGAVKVWRIDHGVVGVHVVG